MAKYHDYILSITQRSCYISLIDPSDLFITPQIFFNIEFLCLLPPPSIKEDTKERKHIKKLFLPKETFPCYSFVFLPSRAGTWHHPCRSSHIQSLAMSLQEKDHTRGLFSVSRHIEEELWATCTMFIG